MTIRLVIADDQTSIREALATMLDLAEDVTVVGTASNGLEAVNLVDANEVDVVLMDLRMPEMDGVEATRLLTNGHPGVAVVVLTTFADDDSILSALGAGARGYLTKEAGRADIDRAIRAAAAGQSVLDTTVQQRLLSAVARPPTTRAAPPDLTAREREVLGLIGLGLPNRAIAERLFVSEATVKTHINNAFSKAAINDRADAVRRALEWGLVPD